jgi:hypothetical protein
MAGGDIQADPLRVLQGRARAETSDSEETLSHQREGAADA